MQACKRVFRNRTKSASCKSLSSCDFCKSPCLISSNNGHAGGMVYMIIPLLRCVEFSVPQKSNGSINMLMIMSLGHVLWDNFAIMVLLNAWRDYRVVYKII